MHDAGYEYIILDDCWSDSRYPNLTLRPDFTKFPNGMGFIADKRKSVVRPWYPSLIHLADAVGFCFCSSSGGL